MRKFYTSIIFLIFCSGIYSQNFNEVDLRLSKRTKTKESIIETGFITIKAGTTVYQTNKLTGLIVYEFSVDSIVKPTNISSDFIELENIGFVNSNSYKGNSFYSPVLDSVVAFKYNLINLLDSEGIPNNTKLRMEGSIELTIDTTFKTMSKINLSEYDKFIDVIKPIGNFYLVENPKIHNKPFYITKDYLGKRVKSKVGYITDNILPYTIRNIDEGNTTSDKEYTYTNWKLIDSFISGNYSSHTYRNGNRFKTITTYNGETSTSYYTQY